MYTFFVLSWIVLILMLLMIQFLYFSRLRKCVRVISEQSVFVRGNAKFTRNACGMALLNQLGLLTKG